MITPPRPDDELQRLKALWRYTMSDRSQDPVLERVTALAAAIYQVPYVLVSLVDEDCQWFKSHHGLEVQSTPREVSFCGHAILGEDVLEVPDASRDERFADNPLVIGAPYIRYYLGVPLRSPEGHAIGTLCLIDTRPRTILPGEQAHLATLATLVMQRLELLRLARQEQVVTRSGLGLWELDIASGSTWWNEAVYSLYEVERDFEHDRVSGVARYVPEDQARLEHCLTRALDEQQPFDLSLRMMLNGSDEQRWVRATGRPASVGGVTTTVSGTIQDITVVKRHEHKLARHQRLDALINRLQQNFIRGDDLAETFDDTLKVLVEMTNSDSGFIGEVYYDDAGAPYLQTHAITDISWDAASLARFQAAGPTGMRFTRLDSLFGEVMRTGKLLISNRADQDPRRGGLPPGHPPLIRFIGLPIHHDDQLVAMLGLANCPTDYTPALAEELAPFLRSLGQLIDSLRLHQEHREAQRRLELASRVFADSREAIFFTDAEQRLIEVNDAFIAITGRSREGLLGQRPSFIEQVACSGGGAWPEADGQWRLPLHWRGEAVVRHSDGTAVPIQLSFSPVDNEGDGRGHGVGVFSDLTEFKRHAEELYLASHTDRLTGLPNRNGLVHLMRDALAECSGGRSLAVGILDLDGFSSINQSLGHAGGDRVLVRVAETLRQALGPREQLARLGGDEYAILLHEYDGHPKVFQRMLAALEAVEQTPRLSGSLGVTLYPQDNADPDTLLRHADQAMYRAKMMGGNTFVFFDLQQEAAMRQRQAMIDSVAAGLAADEFELYFQPQLEITSRSMEGVEALVRWHHPQLGTRPPDAFLSALTGSEVELAFDAWVLEAALAHLAAWYAQGHRFSVSINITPQSLVNEGFADTLAAALAVHPTLPPELLGIEVLESAALDDIAAATRVMERCRQLGVQLALDDFGTGYSSLAYLRDLPVDTVKVDKRFVIGMLEREEDLAIVESVVFMAKRFGKRVVAEGVETLDHIDRLAAMGCHRVQGYGIARPMPVPQLVPWMQSATTPE